MAHPPTPRHRVLTAALWVLALDAVLLVPLAWRARTLARDWARVDVATAVAAAAPVVDRPSARPGGRP